MLRYVAALTRHGSRWPTLFPAYSPEEDVPALPGTTSTPGRKLHDSSDLSFTSSVRTQKTRQMSVHLRGGGPRRRSPGHHDQQGRHKGPPPLPQ